MKLIFFLIIFALNCLAQDYTLVQLGNDYYRSYSRQELMQRMGESSRNLPHYYCNGYDEHDPFWPALRENLVEDSLRVQFPKTDKIIFYRRGQFYNLNGDTVSDLSNSFASNVADALRKLESIEEGKTLLRHLERSFFPITIKLGWNSFNPVDDMGRNHLGIYRANALSIFAAGRMTSQEVPFNDIGAGGNLLWNTNDQSVPTYISLAHELYHAFDSIRGILDMRFVKGNGYEWAFVSEYRAVYFENIIRKKLNIPLRTHYGTDLNGPGMLDESGEPRKLPSPCLNN